MREVKMKTAMMALVALLTTAAFSGCGTFQCCSADDMEAWPIYGGVALDLKELDDTIALTTSERDPVVAKQEADAVPARLRYTIAARVCDLPLSAAADTLLLPVTITYGVAHWMDRLDEASASSPRPPDPPVKAGNSPP